MPPNRRKPTPHPAGPAQNPARRPKVAGLRRPSPTPGQETDDQQDVTEQDVTEQDTTEAEAHGADAADTAEQPASAPRPSGPRRKSRDAGRAKPSSLDEAETADAEEPGTPAVAPATGKGGRSGGDSDSDADADADSGSDSDKADGQGSRPKRVGYAPVAVLLVVGLLLAGAAVFFHLKGSEARAATGNGALIDMGTTSEVNDAMQTAAERLFSIDYNDLGKSEKAAEDLLVGDEVKQKYDALMGEIKRLAPEQQIVVTVNASRSAVVNLDGERARVMVFIDQAATRASDDQSSAGGAAMWLETEKRDGQWKVTNMDTYAAEQPAGGQDQGGEPGAPLPGDQGGQQGGDQGGQGGQQGGDQGGQGGQQGGQGGN